MAKKAAVKTRVASKKSQKEKTRKKPGPKPGTRYKNGLDKSTIFAPKMRLAVKLFEEKLTKNQPFVVAEVLRAAGYSENSVEQYSNVMDPIRQHLQPIINKLETHRNKILERMEEKVEFADYGELVRGLDVTTKNIQLLSGGATENIAVKADFRARVEHLITHQ